MNTQNLSADVQRLYDLANEIAPDPKAEKPNSRWHEEISRAHRCEVVRYYHAVRGSGRSTQASDDK